MLKYALTIMMTTETSDANASFFVESERIKLTREGCWVSDETEITHLGTRRLFFQILQKEGGTYGTHENYFLKIKKEYKEVEVEDTPYFVEMIEGSPKEGFQLRLSSLKTEALDPSTLQFSDGRLTCRTANGFEAKFLRAAYLKLLFFIERDPQGYYLLIQGQQIRLASA
jgi:hypothetical protein